MTRKTTIDIDDDLWEDFKYYTPRTITLNDQLITLVAEYVQDCKEGRRANPNR